MKTEHDYKQVRAIENLARWEWQAEESLREICRAQAAEITQLRTEVKKLRHERDKHDRAAEGLRQRWNEAREKRRA